jgi:uncharacterized protein YdhG (YjbR/CyaY superfamily)
MKKPTTVDEYLAALVPDQRAVLQRLRKTIRAAAPGLEEQISYGIPGFRHAGKWVIYLGASARHCALYGVEETTPGEFAAYDTTGRGTLRFRPDAPPPATLVRKVVKARIAKIDASARSKATPKATAKATSRRR